jgi:hypothetical protein
MAAGQIAHRENCGSGQLGHAWQLCGSSDSVQIMVRDSVVRLCFEVARFQHTTLGPLECGLMVCHALMDCHPERSSRFAKRSSYVVEGPLHVRHSQRSIKAFSQGLGGAKAHRRGKSAVSTNGKGGNQPRKSRTSSVPLIVCHPERSEGPAFAFPDRSRAVSAKIPLDRGNQKE